VTVTQPGTRINSQPFRKKNRELCLIAGHKIKGFWYSANGKVKRSSIMGWWSFAAHRVIDIFVPGAGLVMDALDAIELIEVRVSCMTLNNFQPYI
jgi:hypothetical protein